VIPCFHGEVRGGTIQLYRRDAWLERVKSFEGKRVELVLREFKAKRSDSQNRYLHGVVIPVFAEHCGYTPDEMKEALKWRFLRKDGGPFPTVRGTSELSTKEMADFIDEVCQLAAENGIHIPGPNEVEF
jgi:hypothetical protein